MSIQRALCPASVLLHIEPKVPRAYNLHSLLLSHRGALGPKSSPWPASIVWWSRRWREVVEERRREVAQVYKLLLLPYCRLQRGLLTLSLAAVHLAIIKDCSTADPSRRTNRREGSNFVFALVSLYQVNLIPWLNLKHHVPFYKSLSHQPTLAWLGDTVFAEEKETERWKSSATLSSSFK